MKTKPRWMKSVIKATGEPIPQMPFERSAKSMEASQGKRKKAIA